MKRTAQPFSRFAPTRRKNARIRALVALAVGTFMVFGATQAVDTSAALTDSVIVKSGQLAVDANLLPRSQFVSCVDQGGAPNPRSTVTWKHLGPGYSYYLEVRWRDGTFRYSTTVTAGVGAGRGSNISYQILQDNVWALGALGRNMTLRILPVLNGVRGTNWVGTYLHLGSAQHMYCNGATWGSGEGEHIYPKNLFNPGDGTPLARNAQPSMDDEKLAPTTATAVENPNDTDTETSSAPPSTTSVTPSTTGQTTPAPSDQPTPMPAPSTTDQTTSAPVTPTSSAIPATSTPPDTVGPISTSESGDYSAARSANGKALIITDPTGTYELAYAVLPDAAMRWDGDDLVVVEGDKQTRISKSSGQWQVVLESASTAEGVTVTPN
ncbi:hypothetical protein E5720_13000 [Rhodococcus sp. PAMC28707]|uniref:hypothetical protein n=1 Tax=unclassified Rhodococcus (in: high G+C Gram-positive bacteria) TaxID=192944 RepID=UPI00109DFE69|nr:MULTISPECIES: hypothetical protein [unclassified Rhodococcus (in: high G+C Gram-positive bacteria)]QCB49039.1 hypothetical protein E5769_01015 [Rhodococcus sp. PAMC28705]QCB59273.1 hypothetical protein E5720_13000 [Rhodococcus sp. PAMC28707]